MSPGRRRRLAVSLVFGAALFSAALSTEVYEKTSPAWLSWHVLLRKAYSVAAFAALAALVAPLWAGRHTVRRVTLLLAIYSAAIEVGQWLIGGREGLAYNVLDVACGAVGGWLGALAAHLFPARPKGAFPIVPTSTGPMTPHAKGKDSLH